MTDTFATSARPPNAAIAWAYGDAIFVELPTKAGPPYVVRYHKTADGLRQALNILIENPAPSGIVNQAHPAVRRMGKEPTPEIRSDAAAILKRMKIT